MLITIKCFTCSRVISKKLDEYLKDLNNINNDPSLSKQKKEELGAKLRTGGKYDFRGICCQGRILGIVEYHNTYES